MLSRISVAASLLAVSFAESSLAAPGDQKPAIDQQLKTTYFAARVGTNGVVTQPGTILVVQEDGIKAIPSAYRGYLANNVKKGGKVKLNIIQHVGTAPVKEYLADSRLLQVGEKVYLTNIETKDTAIVFSVQSCGGCNPAAVDRDPPFRASLSFEFPKGYLAGAEFKEVQETINRIFVIDTAAAAPLTAPAMAAPASPAVQAPPTAPGVPPAAPEPATISLGQSKDAVVTALGQPERVARAGNKEIYFYKDLKITFVDGKVSDVQ